MKGLVERLRGVRYVREGNDEHGYTIDLSCDEDDYGARSVSRNPDGPEAAAAIEALEARVAELDDALSAERERVADMQRRLDLWEPKTTSGSSIAVSSRIGGNNAPLAAQKAEGA